jgi:acetolactate synthase-1/2/3 large subunit
MWDAIGDTTASIIDTRDERAAVHAAHAEAEVTGDLGVAMVTAGPGFTNAVTGIANADASGVPLLVVTGYPPVPQFERGALQVYRRIGESGGRRARPGSCRDPDRRPPRDNRMGARAAGPDRAHRPCRFGGIHRAGR